MPLLVVKILNLGELTPTTMTLQMADRSLAQPEDVLIKVGKFIFPVDFAVIDIEEDKQVPLLLSKPFLATEVALIDIKKGEFTLRVGDEAVHFNLNQSLKQPEFYNANCKTIETIVPISFVTPQTRGSVDYPSTRGIQVDVGLPGATSENRAESPLYGELYPNKTPA